MHNAQAMQAICGYLNIYEASDFDVLSILEEPENKDGFYKHRYNVQISLAILTFGTNYKYYDQQVTQQNTFQSKQN